MTSGAASALGEAGIQYLDVGVSGGVWGDERGYCLMIGGEAAAVARLDPVFKTLAPGRHAAPLTEGRAARPARPKRATCTAGRPAPGTS